ncbi:MBL fold metallo-hydrolase [Paenibacillus sp. JMULE4]|uniref:MBL fold metallo-hydrolase n=1 Tax=Paenibacillus TaxID=44249 RepID=UPI0010B48973|nr:MULTISPECIES: MBL fold metallo-hydrolase [Paenibacillus]NTZ17131.1 MBL fold metallo-hydrolase [Paenibacillus sp. JMULE4]GCL72767.1 MBL fold metallo-hydrolase [Paenibacillus naphthalenovorans]
MSSRLSLSTTVTEHGDVLQVKVPLPFPLRFVNSYLLPGPGGWTLIDPGLRTEAAELLWESVLAERGIRFDHIERIVLTHHHPDHYGLAGWFQERSGGAPVLMSQTAWEQTRLLWGEDQPMTEKLMALFRTNGLPAELEKAVRENMDSFVQAVLPQPQVTIIDEAQKVRLGKDDYEPIHTPGHASGHLIFYRAETATMFCGDHVLPQISPNVSYLPGIDENPLASYMASLELISRYEVRLAFPGHREPFAHLQQRAKELIAHHRQRLESMRVLLTQPRTAYDVCRAAFGEKLSTHQLRFALSETVAHLIWLREQGAARCTERDGIIRYEQQ